jgi:hypothetical protein
VTYDSGDNLNVRHDFTVLHMVNEVKDVVGEPEPTCRPLRPQLVLVKLPLPGSLSWTLDLLPDIENDIKKNR